MSKLSSCIRDIVVNYDYSVIDSLCVNVLLQIDDGKHVLVEQILVLHLFCHLSEEVNDNLTFNSKVDVKGGGYDVDGDNDTMTKALSKLRQTFLSLDSLQQKPNPKSPKSKSPKSNKPKPKPKPKTKNPRNPPVQPLLLLKCLIKMELTWWNSVL